MKKNKSNLNILESDFNLFTELITNFIDKLPTRIIPNLTKTPLIKSCIDKNLIQIAHGANISNAKRIRPLFCFWLSRFFEIHNQKNAKEFLNKVNKIALSIELLHNASLIIDDIEDDSSERRQKPAIHLQFGLPNTLNAATWLYFIAIQNMPQELNEIVTNTLLECHVGQALDLSSHQKLFTLKFLDTSYEEKWIFYEKCVELKTTKLIHLSLECFAKIIPISDCDFTFLTKIIKKYGLIFQIYDDLKNLFSEFSGDKMHEDLKSGLRSIISIEFLKLLNSEEKLSAISKFELNEFYLFMIQHTKFNQAIHKCYLIAENLISETSLELDLFLESKPQLREYISQLFDFPFIEIRSKLKMELQLNNVCSISTDNILCTY